MKKILLFSLILAVSMNGMAGTTDHVIAFNRSAEWDDDNAPCIPCVLTLTSAPGTDNQTVCVNTPITDITYSSNTPSQGVTFSGLPAGVTGSYNASAHVVTISGTPTETGTFTYSVTVSGICSPLTFTGTITVQPNATITLTSESWTTNQTVCNNTLITNITYSIGGTGTGAGVTGLPPGVSGLYYPSPHVFQIYGTPTVAGTFNYTVTSLGSCPLAVTGTITVNPDATIILTSASGTNNQLICLNCPIMNITYSIGGGGTGGTVTGLPPGVGGAYNAGMFTISGTPTEAGSFNYTVTTTGMCSGATATGTITVQQPTFCTPFYSSGCIDGDGLTLFHLGTIDQAIPCSGTPAWYHDYTASSTMVQASFSYTLTVKSGYANTHVRVWIDLDNDDLFDHPEEIMVSDLNCVISGQNYTASVTIPGGTPAGDHLLRFRTNFADTVTDACTPLISGNSADFTVNVLQGPITIGTGSFQCNYPYTTFWMDGRTQILLTAAEIIAAGGSPGEIQQVGFHVSQYNDYLMKNFNLRMQNTTLTSLTNIVNSGWTTCYTGDYAVPGAGWQMIQLHVHFPWDGSNLLFDLCYDNNSYDGYSYVYGSPAINMCKYVYTDLPSASLCEAAAGTSATIRPNFRFVERPNLVTLTGTVSDVTCYNAVQTITVAGGSNTFTVKSGGNATMIAGQQILFKPTTKVYPGGYMHGCISNTWCGGNTNAPMLAVESGQEEPTAPDQSMFRIYPNPTTGSFTLELASEPGKMPVKVRCYNLVGWLIMEEDFYSGTTHELSLAGQMPGIYLVRVIQEGETGVRKIVRQ